MKFKLSIDLTFHRFRRYFISSSLRSSESEPETERIEK